MASWGIGKAAWGVALGRTLKKGKTETVGLEEANGTGVTV